MAIWKCAGFGLSTEPPLVMGVLNVTPDSFSDGGQHSSLELAYEHAIKMVDEGAAIIDVGGESTRPGSDEVSADEELRRVLPVVESLAAAGLVVSIDTRHALVASECVKAGAAIINDVSGFRDPAMVDLAAATDVGCIVMHMLGEPKSMQAAPIYLDAVREVQDYLLGQAALLEQSGVAPGRIAIDPGPGFGKDFDHNLALLRATAKMAALGYPLVAAYSRKAFIGRLTGAAVPAERVSGSVAVAAYAASQGAGILRVHDVAATVQALKVAAVLAGAGLGGDRGTGDGSSPCAPPPQDCLSPCVPQDDPSPCPSPPLDDPPSPLRPQGRSRRVFVGLGSNHDDALEILPAAVAAIGSVAEVLLLRGSSIYRSEPAYFQEQPDFYNSVVELQTSLEPSALLGELQAIEVGFGRTRSQMNGPRSLDLDIIDFQGVVSDDPELMLPHPQALERDFVVRPLLELAPGLVLADGQQLTAGQVEYGLVTEVVEADDGAGTGTAEDSPAAEAPPCPSCPSQRPWPATEVASAASPKASPRDTSSGSGRLSICATPIGNLGDISQRVINALQSADVVLAEDTRVARRLLSHLNIRAKLERCDENSIRQRSGQIVQRILEGSHFAYVSDAGMPTIADPGAFLVAAARQAGCAVEVLPGASAVLTALAASGFITQRFFFGGFLPRKQSQIGELLGQLACQQAALVFFESPHRTAASLRTIAECLPERELVLARELTKLHEEVLRAPASELAELISDRERQGQMLRGEVVIVIAPSPDKRQPKTHQDRYADKKGKKSRERG